MDKIKTFLNKYETKLILTIGFILVGIIAFQIGYLEGKKMQSNPVIIEKIVETTQKEPVDNSTIASSYKSQEIENSFTQKNKAQDCAFVGSKNSSKFHLPTCSWAKRIKPENLVCYKSFEDAIAQGKQPDKSCIK